MLPVAFLYLFDNGERRKSWLKLSLAGLPALLIFALLRLLIDTSGGEPLLSAFMHHSRKLFSPAAIFRLFVNPSLPLTLIPLIYFRGTMGFLKRHNYLLLFLALVYMSSLFGSNNERLVAPLFIVFYWLLAEIIQGIGLPSRVIIFAFTFIASFHHMIGWWPLPDRRMTMLLTFGATFVITGLLLEVRVVTVQRGR